MLEQVTWRHVGYAVLGAGVGGILGAGLLLALLPALPAAEIVELVRSVELFSQSDARIRQLEESWQEAINAGDVDAVVALFAAEGRILPPGRPPLVGTAAIRQCVEDVAALPALSFEAESDSVEVAAAADLAYSRGRFRMAWGEPGARQEKRGQYVVVWRKIEGEWRVLIDVFNSEPDS
jgi:uncharacterized protein (TIGR02246 family)